MSLTPNWTCFRIAYIPQEDSKSFKADCKEKTSVLLGQVKINIPKICFIINNTFNKSQDNYIMTGINKCYTFDNILNFMLKCVSFIDFKYNCKQIKGLKFFFIQSGGTSFSKIRTVPKKWLSLKLYRKIAKLSVVTFHMLRCQAFTSAITLLRVSCQDFFIFLCPWPLKGATLYPGSPL